MVCPICQVVIEAGAESLISHMLDGHPDEAAAVSAARGISLSVWRRHWLPIVLGAGAAAYLLSRKPGQQGA
jgi:hypothetical protein